MWHRCSLLPQPWLQSHSSITKKCSLGTNITPPQEKTEILSSSPASFPTLSSSPECLGQKASFRGFLPCPSSEAAAWGRGGQAQVLRGSAGPRSQTSPKALLLAGSTLLDLHPSFRKTPGEGVTPCGDPFTLRRPRKQPCQAPLQLSTLLRSPAGLGGATGVAAEGITHSIAGMFGADMGLTSLAF